MASSYDKIARHLMGTPEAQEYLNEIRQSIERAEIVKYEFGLVRREGQPVQARCSFVVRAGTGSGSISKDQHGNWSNLSSWSFLHDDALKDIVDRNWKTKRCPTYNCKKDDAMHGKDTRDGERSVGFYGAMRGAVDAVCREELDSGETRLQRMNRRLHVQAEDVMASEEWKRDEFEYLRGHAVRDIVAVMKNYDFLGKEVLREALDQFVMHQIMETDPDNLEG